MLDWLKNVVDNIKNLNVTVEDYKKDTVIQSLPSLTFVNRAKKLIEKQQYEEAKAILLDATELPQKDALVYKYLGITYDKLREFELAVEAYQNSADINPHDKIIWQKLGFALIAVHKYNEAEKSFENADTIMPANTDTFTGWGMALMKLNRLAEAEEKFYKATAVNKYNFSAIFLGAVINIKMGYYDKAESKLSFLANICPNDTNSYEYANLKYLKNDYDNAIHYATKALSYNPDILPAYILLGKIYAKRFCKETAYQYFQTAQDRELTTAMLYLEWAIAMIKFGEYSQAQEKLLQALAMNPDDNDIKAHLALVNTLIGKIEESASLVENNSMNRIFKVVEGILAYKNNDFETAIRTLRETLRDELDDSISHYFLAKSYQALNNESKTKENYEAAVNKNLKYLIAYIDFAKYLISREDYADAQRKLRKALKIDENNIEILNLLFFAGYMLVKDNGSEYNIKEILQIAQKIEENSPELFEHADKKEELTTIISANTGVNSGPQVCDSANNSKSERE